MQLFFLSFLLSFIHISIGISFDKLLLLPPWRIPVDTQPDSKSCQVYCGLLLALMTQLWYWQLLFGPNMIESLWIGAYFVFCMCFANLTWPKFNMLVFVMGQSKCCHLRSCLVDVLSDSHINLKSVLSVNAKCGGKLEINSGYGPKFGPNILCYLGTIRPWVVVLNNS